MAIRVFLVGFSVVVLLLAGIAFATWLGRQELKKKVQAELSALDARHSVYRLEDMQAGYQIPAKNATPLYLEAFSKLKVPELKSQELVQLFKGSRPVSFPSVDTNLLAALAEAEKENQEFVLKLRRANTIITSRYPVDLTQGMAAKMKHLKDISESAKVLRALSWNAVLTGRRDAAMDYLLDLLQMSQSLEAEPVLVSQIIRGNCLYMAAGLLEEILSTGAPEPAMLERLRHLLEKFEQKDAIIRSLAFERCVMVDTLTGPLWKKWECINYDQSTQGTDELVAVIGLWKMEKQGIHERDLLIALDLFDEMDHAIVSQDMVGALDQVEAELAPHRVFQEGKVPAIIPGMLLPGVIKGLKQLAEVEAMKIVLQTAVAIQRYQLANGRLPENLNMLVPDYLPNVPVDPFISKPLAYWVSSEGYQLYSVGMDRQDDGGRRFSGAKDGFYDLVIKVRSVH